MALEIQVLALYSHKTVVGLNQLMGSQPSPLTNWISNGDTYINKRYKNPAQTCFHPIRPHTIANMNDSVSLAMHTRGTRRKFLFIHIRGGAVLVVIFGLTTTYAISAFQNLSSNPAHSEMYSI